MNVYDSQRMADVLAPLGYGPADSADEADMVIVNTCHIREKAAEKLYSELGRCKLSKDQRRSEGADTLIAVAGCVAQAEGEEILRRAPYVDIVLGPQTYHRLPEMVAKVTRAHNEKTDGKKRKGQGVLDIEFPAEPKFDHLPEVRADGVSAFLSVQEGCDKFCTFCVVPYTRGAEYSRSVEDVLTEARHLVSNGVREVTLLGQNVNAFHGPWDAGPTGTAGLGDLIRTLAEVDGLNLIRYTTSHPIDMDESLIKAHGEVEKLVPFLHLPVQSGSDKMLQKMNRRHSRDDYLRIIEKLDAARPGLKLSSDFIVGFPGESDADFENTMSLVRDVGFIQAFSFKYSPRPGTPGALMTDRVPEDVQSARLAALQQLLNDNQQAFNQSCVGKIMPVLLDRPGRKPGQLAGKSPYMQAVHVTSSEAKIGDIAELRIVDALPNSLSAVMVDPGITAATASSERITA